MRSIFGRCIAIAMMAAIALAWQSPPVQAQTDDQVQAKKDAERVAEEALAHAIAADNAAEEAKIAAENAEEAAAAAEASAKEAEDARDAVIAADGSTAEKSASRNAARDARNAARAARDKAGAEEELAADVDAGRPAVIMISDVDDDDAWGDYLTASAAAGMENEDSVDNTQDNAWDNYRQAKAGADADADAVDLSEVESNRDEAKDNKEAAEKARDSAVDNQGSARVRATFAEERAAVAAEAAGTAAAAAVTAAEADVAEAQTAYDANPTLANLQDLEDARGDLETAETRAGDWPDDTMMACPAGQMMGDDGMCIAEGGGPGTEGPDTEGPDTEGPEMADMGMQVAPNGVGDLLLFGYWTTQMGRNTLVALTNTGSMMANVHVRVREGAGSQDVGDFTICMGAGDVWTAAIVPDGTTSRLMVGNAGSCAGTSALPADGLIIGSASGYLEAFTIAMDGGADSLAGTATIVSVMDGFASSYNATALVGLDAMTTSAATGGPNVQYALAREGGVDKEMLIGRWTATTTPVVSRTHVVLTFPGSGQPGKDDPITALIYNEDGQSNNSPRSLMLDQEVNVCTFWNKDDTMNNRVALDCNGGNKLLVDFEGGWFKLLNNTEGAEMDDAMPAKRLAAIGLQFSIFVGDNGSFDQSYPIQWMAYSGAGGMGAAPWNYMMDDGTMMMIDPGDNMKGSVEMMGMEEPEM